jgi:hypothetical protein
MRETPHPGSEPDLVPEPLRLTGARPRRGLRSGHQPARRDGGRVPANRRPPGRMKPRRRRGDRRAIAASALAVLALVGCVIAVLMLATEPTAARLERDISSLTRRLSADQTQLTRLTAAVDRTGAAGTALRHQLGHVAGRLAGLRRTVHGLQAASTVEQQQAVGLRVCVPQLQEELTGLVLQTRSVRGRVTSVGLHTPVLPSAPCQALFSGL